MALENGENIFKMLTLLHSFERNFVNAANPTERTFEVKGQLCGRLCAFGERHRLLCAARCFRSSRPARVV